jgi:hypothetical protein
MPFYGLGCDWGMKGENFLSAFVSLLPVFHFRFLLGLNFPLFSLTPESSAGEFGSSTTTRGTDAPAPRPNLSPLDQLFCGLARRFWSAWRQALLVVTPETVVRWHRAVFRLYGSLISKVRRQVGRKTLSQEVRDLIFQMVAENSSWGAPRIHGELLMPRLRRLGTYYFALDVTRTPKSRTRSGDGSASSQSSRSHRRHGLFTVPTLTFGLLYGFFISSSSVMIGDAFYISTSPVIPPVAGSCSTCERRFLTSRPPVPHLGS